MTLPIDHQARMARARLALEGLSVGDAFGERFFTTPGLAEILIEQRALPQSPWHYTDDTVMGLAIVEELDAHATIDQSSLASRFADKYASNPSRGYGGTAHRILQDIAGGQNWRDAARAVFAGMGSMGNGGAMRAAPIGAYFADNVWQAVTQARLSAEVTHAHLEGQVGAAAVAAATALAVNRTHCGRDLLTAVVDLLPPSETRSGIIAAANLPLDYSVSTAVTALGNGTKLLSQDTVPFSLWCAARHLDNFTEGMWTTVSALGDRDTTCAIVGGIIATATDIDGIPFEWRQSREPLRLSLRA